MLGIDNDSDFEKFEPIHTGFEVGRKFRIQYRIIQILWPICLGILALTVLWRVIS